MAAPLTRGLNFSEKSNLYDLDVTDLNVWDSVSAELWLQPFLDCPSGAVILDKIGPGTGQGMRLRTSAGGALRLIVSEKIAVQTEVKLAADGPTHVVAAFDPREKTVAIYLDGKPAASLPERKDKIVIIGSQTPLRIGSDYRENRFSGNISYLAIYNRALTVDRPRNSLPSQPSYQPRPNCKVRSEPGNSHRLWSGKSQRSPAKVRW